ncbi:putative Small-conductance mechanosensitive channel [Candidatus Defluviicoccus seviourii]|uniref:Small-conductance mechanosensitive channel n=1 Tax=Candidatus Defluviicoccus seviourii TaxID=2565273 RepID=A0A564WJ77_9PROT|nr:putative Small-conductance mechanosensitive channel [Candidatus Defluviicoccus seviourii]
MMRLRGSGSDGAHWRGVEPVPALLVSLAVVVLVSIVLAASGWAAEPAADADIAAAEPDSLLFRIQADMYTLHGRLKEMLAAAAELPSLGPFILRRITKGYGAEHVWQLVASTLVILAVAWAGEGMARRLFRPLLIRLPALDTRSDFGKLGVLALRFIVSTVELAAFALIAIAMFFLVYQGHEAARLAFWTILAFVLCVRTGAAFLRLLLAPDQGGLRLPAIDDATARQLYWSFLFLAALGAATVLSGLFLDHIGVDPALLLAFGQLILVLNFVAIVAVIGAHHDGISRLVGIRSAEGVERATGLGGLIAGHWYVFAICYVVAMALSATANRLLTGETQTAHTVPTLAVLIAVPILHGLLRMAVDRFFGDRAAVSGTPAPVEMAPVEMAPVEMALLETEPSAVTDVGDTDGYGRVIMRNGNILLGVVVVLLLAEIWEVDLDALAAHSLGARIANSLFDIIITLILASAGWGIIKTAINRQLPHERLGALALVEDEAMGTGLTRLETLLPLLRKFLFITLLVTVALIAISAMGINIGPLLAGAGVVGIAVGFGAQTLVRDIISGVFFLIDDAFRVGEYIDVGEGKGTVERMSVRALMLRHHLGQINTIPFGVIRRVTNYSRDWAIMKLELRVPFDADLEQVRKIVKQVGQEMMADPEYGQHFIQPLKSQGVHRMDDSSFIVRVKFMARPGEQFVLRREVFRRVQEAFQQHGIKFAPRRVIVDAPPTLGPAAAAAVAAEAAGAGGADGAKAG